MPTRVGFIGAGFIGERHIKNMQSFPDVQVAGVADVAFDRAQSQAALVGAHPYRDFREMLDREQLDAVYICVPPFAHGEPEFAALDRRLPFFVEKPLALNWELAQDIGLRVQQSGLITAAGYHWRYLTTTEQAQDLLRERPARLALGYWLDFTPPPAWWVVEAQSGGQMVEQTTHIFDLARLLVGEVTRVYGAAERTPRAAYPQADICEVSLATVHFDSGALGNFASTCLLNWPHRIGLHLFSEGMAIELGEFDMLVDVGKGRPITKPEGDPFLREDRDFIDAVQGQANRIRVPYIEALKTHRVVTLAQESAREGRIIDIAQGKVNL